jgi:hypothetical protein
MFASPNIQVLSALRNEYRIVEPTQPPMLVAREIARAPMVYSSSLHGLIVAHALGVPAVLLPTGTVSHSEPSWKYDDYFSSIDEEYSFTEWSRLTVRSSLADIEDFARSRAPIVQTKASVMAEVLELTLRAFLG